MKHRRILILDFGSQYTQLIARAIRALHLYCEVVRGDLSCEEVQRLCPDALILSGGPASVYSDEAPPFDAAIFQLDLPILGICYGQQLMAHHLGGRVIPSEKREYGRAHVRLTASAGDPASPSRRMVSKMGDVREFEVWMSHGDSIDRLPKGFVALAETNDTPFAAIGHQARPLVGLQFHPEVQHSTHGVLWLQGFLFEVAKLRPDWTMERYVDEAVARVHKQVGPTAHVLCALSGGVDSSVTAALLGRALGPRLHCVFVDNGLLRQGERAQVEALFEGALALPLTVADARFRFIQALADITDPERKRKIIGSLFIDIFEEEAARLAAEVGEISFLAQGTLYSDVIESVSPLGKAHTIKSHHNVGGLPERMRMKLIEPLRTLFKDEVRLLGIELGLPQHVCYRQPFPGPGLAVRMVGAVTEPRLIALRRADQIVRDEMALSGADQGVWQNFAVLLPVRSVGVMGDRRTYEETCAIRCVTSADGMTADWARVDHEVLAKMSSRIVGEVKGINRVVYDISSKPPATIEWE